MRWGEAVLGVLGAAGFTGTRRVIAFRALLAYLFGALQVARLGPLAGAGTRRLAALPDTKFPLLAATARDALAVDPDDEFRGGLSVLLRGMREQRS